jgi:hypothetical protein
MKGDLAVIDILRDTLGVYSLIGGSGTSARVYPIQAAQGERFPRCIVEKTDETPFDSKSGISETDHDFVSVFSEGQTATAAKELSYQVRLALNGYANSTANDVYVEYIRYVTESDYTDRIENNTIYGVEQQYEVRTIFT